MPGETIHHLTNTQADAWDKLTQAVELKTTPTDTENEINGTLDDGVDIGREPFEEPKADLIESKLEWSDGTTKLRANPESTAVTLPNDEADFHHDDAEATALAANQRADEDYQLADEAFAIEEPNAPQL